MSYLYDEYLYDHRKGVQDAYYWLVDKGIISPAIEVKLDYHDFSKNSPEEYKAYDDYFYGNKSSKVVEAFNYAWLHHIHHNPHHWQYWVLQHDDEPEEVLEMPENYVYEMICDWWSFSFKNKDLYSIFDWYEKHKGMKLHSKTRKLVEETLQKIRDILDEEDHLEHHGITGQKWGVKNGPSYPINTEKMADKVAKNASDHIKKIESDVGYAARASGSELYGLENKLKTKESIERKINKNAHEDAETLLNAANDIKDAVRFTTISSEKDFVRNYNIFKKTLEEEGYSESRCKNYFDLFNKGEVKHKSVQSTFTTDDGYDFEVQFHTKASQDAKNKKLPLYEERRKEGIAKERATELERMMEDLAKEVRDPDGIETIKSHN